MAKADLTETQLSVVGVCLLSLLSVCCVVSVVSMFFVACCKDLLCFAWVLCFLRSVLSCQFCAYVPVLWRESFLCFSPLCIAYFCSDCVACCKCCMSSVLYCKELLYIVCVTIRLLSVARRLWFVFPVVSRTLRWWRNNLLCVFLRSMVRWSRKYLKWQIENVRSAREYN
jgi:hypothetical protein